MLLPGSHWCLVAGYLPSEQFIAHTTHWQLPLCPAPAHHDLLLSLLWHQSSLLHCQPFPADIPAWFWNWHSRRKNLSRDLVLANSYRCGKSIVYFELTTFWIFRNYTKILSLYYLFFFSLSVFIYKLPDFQYDCTVHALRINIAIQGEGHDTDNSWWLGYQIWMVVRMWTGDEVVMEKFCLCTMSNLQNCNFVARAFFPFSPSFSYFLAFSPSSELSFLDHLSIQFTIYVQEKTRVALAKRMLLRRDGGETNEGGSSCRHRGLAASHQPQLKLLLLRERSSFHLNCIFLIALRCGTGQFGGH